MPKRGIRGGEGHLDIDLAFVRLEVDVVHQTEVVDVDRDLGVVALPQDADHFFLRGHGGAFDESYVGRRILTFRFRRERLAARESTAKGVPPSDSVLAPLPAQVGDVVSHFSLIKSEAVTDGMGRGYDIPQLLPHRFVPAGLKATIRVDDELRG